MTMSFVDVRLQLLAKHSELQQSEIKAQAAMVTILSLTQITELKLLLDIGRQGHRFYDFVLTMLIACISLELFIGIIVIYVGNLHYYQQQERGAANGLCTFYGLCRLLACICCRCRCCDPARCCRRRGAYSSVTEVTTGRGIAMKNKKQTTGAIGSGSGVSASLQGLKAPTAVPEPTAEDEEEDMGLWCCGGGPDQWQLPHRSEASTMMELEQADAQIEAARIKAADAELRIVRSANYMRVLEEAIRRGGGGSSGASGASAHQQQQQQIDQQQQHALEEDLAQMQAEHAAAVSDKREAEVERQMAEARQRHAFYARETATERRERITFRKLSRWQHAATYLLYFVMLMNVFVTTFGISGSSQDLFVGGGHLTSTTPKHVYRNVSMVV